MPSESRGARRVHEGQQVRRASTRCGGFRGGRRRVQRTVPRYPADSSSSAASTSTHAVAGGNACRASSSAARSSDVASTTRGAAFAQQRHQAACRQQRRQPARSPRQLRRTPSTWRAVRAGSEHGRDAGRRRATPSAASACAQRFTYASNPRQSSRTSRSSGVRADTTTRRGADGSARAARAANRGRGCCGRSCIHERTRVIVRDRRLQATRCGGERVAHARPPPLRHDIWPRTLASGLTSVKHGQRTRRTVMRRLRAGQAR